MSKPIVIHLGNAGKGAIDCGAPAKKNKHGNQNWSWKTAEVTCKKCIALYRMRCGR